jgi:hypothetical protein
MQERTYYIKGVSTIGWDIKLMSTPNKKASHAHWAIFSLDTNLGLFVLGGVYPQY